MKHPSRIDQFPMRRVSPGILTEKPALHEIREADPAESETPTRRVGSVRQTQYTSAAGFAAPGSSYWQLDTNALDVSGQTNGFTIAFQVALGSIQEAAGKIYLIEGQQKANFAAKDANNTFKIWAEKAGGAYTIKANIYDNSGVAGLTGVDALSIPTTPDTNIKVALRVDGPMGTPEVTLYVDASEDDGTLASGTYTMNGCTLSILGPTASPEGTITVIDPINIFKNVDPTSEEDWAMASRSPTTTPQIQLNCDSKAPISPATGIGDALPYPSKPLLDEGELRFNGLSGAVRVPFNSVFDRFFTSNLSSVASNVFAFKVTFSREFLTEQRTTTLFEFPGFAKLELEADTGELLFTYSEQTRWETGADFHSDLNTETTVWVGCDGTNLFIYNGTDTATTSAAGTELPFIDHRRIPDLFIGADEDKENDTNFHGSLLGFSIFDYAATSDDGEAIFDLQHRADSVEDVSAFNIALALETHAPTSALPSIAPGPVQDADHKAILAGEVLVPAGVIGATSTLRAEDGIFSKAATGLKLGDKLFLNEPDGALCVADVRRNKLRPLGLPEIGQEVSVRNIRSSGILDGVYQYGARFASGDGTYGPIRRLKPVKALGGTKVVLGTTKEGDEDSGKTELGASYGLTHDGVENYFLFDDDNPGDSNVHGNSVEVFAAFPGFNDYEESVFDRYSQNRTTSSKGCAWVAYRAGLELDTTKDFTIGFSFKFDSSTLADSVTHTQCLFSVGPNDLQPWLPAFQVMLYKGHGWGNDTDFRLVVARSVNRRYRLPYYRIGTIDDGSGGDFEWTTGQNYTVVVTRKGNALRIHVHDVTADVWHSYDTLPSEATNGQALDSFFNSNNGGYDADQRLLHWGSSGFGETGNGTANHMDEQFKGVTATGGHGNNDEDDNDASEYVGGLSENTHWYHARAWETAVSKDAIKTHFEMRFATKTEPGFDHGLVSDVAFITDDIYDKPDKFWDRAAKVYWSCYEGDNTTAKVSNPARSYFEQTKTLGDVQYALMVTDTDETAAKNAEIQLYASPLGDGSVTLSTGEESFTIVSELWNPFSERVISFDELKLGGLNVDAENFNWYTISTVMTTVGSNFDITLKDYALNGQEIMAFSMDSPKDNTLEKAKFIIYLGGFKDVTNTADTWIGEFRMWQGNRYQDEWENYDYLDTRARQDSNEVLNLHYFAKFQPFDENDPVDGTFKNWGLVSGNFEKKGPGGSWSTPNPEIFDARTIDDEDIDNPAPAVSFPDAAYPYITAIELFRTKRIGISDERDEQEITKALTNVEGNPLRFLARIPIGEASFIDNIHEDTLGNVISESSGFVPSRPDGIFTWDDRLGVFKDGIISLGAQGPFGWESFESASQYHVPNQGLSDIVAAIPYANSLAVFGADWGTILTGSSESPRPYYLGGVGAQSARAVTTYAGSVYVLGDGALWRVTPPSGLSAPAAEDFGAPIIDKLPTNGRLSVSSINASLYVINEDTGETLRFYFPSQRWTIEDRDALSVGDLSSGFGVVHLGSGSYSLKNSTIVGDDLNANTDESSTGSLSGNTLTMTNPNAPTGTRVLVVDSEGASIYTTVTGYTGGALTTTDSLVSLEDGTVDVELGIGEEGFLYDTGWYENPVGHDISQTTLKTGILSGTGFQIALDGDSVPGSRTASSSTFIDIGALADVRHQGASRGRWIRARIRNRKAEAAKLDRINLMHDLEQ